MPELPEVETLRRELAHSISPEIKLTKILLRRADIRFPIPADFVSRLTGQSFLRIRRRAKYLLFETESEVMISHLGMSGGWVFKDENFIPSVHDHCEIEFSDQSVLVYRDPRRFGVLDVVKKGQELIHPLLHHLGPEPLDAEIFTASYLYRKSRGRSTALKIFLMDQGVVVGVGNIYASEALFLAGLSPRRAAQGLNMKKAARLVLCVQEVLQKAILAGGSTIRDYRSLRGLSGEFQGQHWVYDRADQPCKRCDTLIKQINLGGRSSYFCPQCQSESARSS